MSQLHAISVDADGQRTRRDLLQALRRFNEQQVGPQAHEDVILSVRTPDGTLIAGLAGAMFWNTLSVDFLWVDETVRRQGYGQALLKAAEDLLVRRGGDIAYLNTWTFQAPEFYRKNGYLPFGELQGSPPGHSRLWFCKRFSRSR
jgi:GNAT superfamily N-acetyltransferase